jgi:hypothetical protein
MADPVKPAYLAQIIVRQTGRYDLVGTEVVAGETIPKYSTDNGIMQKIYAAIQLLEENICVRANRRKRHYHLLANAYNLPVPNLIRLASGKMSHTVVMSGETSELTLIDESELFEEFVVLGEYTEYGDVDSSTPLYISRVSSDDVTTPLTADSANLVVMPPPNAVAVVWLTGWFRSPKTAASLDTNWWVLEHEDAVINAAIQIIQRGVLNPATDPTIGTMLAEIKKAILSSEIAEEIAICGPHMKGC